MNLKKVEKSPSKKNPHNADVRLLYDKESAQVLHITLQPGESLKPHVTPVDVCFYVLQGEGIVEIGEEKETAAADTVIESPKDIVHCWYNEAESPLRILVIKAPRPEKKTRLL